MFGIGGGEIVVVALVALILFGNEDLPKNMKKLVEGWNKFRGVSNDLQRSWLNVRDQVTRDLLSDEHPRPPESDSSNPTENQASNESGSDLPPPEGLHDGALSGSAVVIQAAEGTVAQGESVDALVPESLVDQGTQELPSSQTVSHPDSDKST